MQPTEHKPRGRPIGAKNIHTREREAVLAATRSRLEAIIGPNAFAGDAHAFLTYVYKSDEFPMEMRIDCAKAAVPYEKPRLSAIDLNVGETKRFVARMPAKASDAAEWMAGQSIPPPPPVFKGTLQ